MCLGIPGHVVETDGLLATVDVWGVRKTVRVLLLDEPVAPGDWVLTHLGDARRRIAPEDVEATLAMYASLVDGEPEELVRETVDGDQLQPQPPPDAP